MKADGTQWRKQEEQLPQRPEQQDCSRLCFCEAETGEIRRFWMRVVGKLSREAGR